MKIEEISADFVCKEFLVKVLTEGVKNNFTNPTHLIKKGSLLYIPIRDFVELPVDEFSRKYINQAVNKLSALEGGCGEWDMATFAPFYKVLELKISLPCIPNAYSANIEMFGVQSRVVRAFDVGQDEMVTRFDILYYF